MSAPRNVVRLRSTMRHLLAFAVAFVLVALPGCAHSTMERAGDAMLRAERASQAVVDGVVAFKDATKDDCVAQDLATESERAACVERAVKAIEISRVGISAVAAALTTFWETYAVLQARVDAGERVSKTDLLMLADHGAKVIGAYDTLVREIQEVRR